MAEPTDRSASAANLRARMDLTTIVAVLAMLISGVSFYFSYFYTKQELEVTVTEVSYVTNKGELYMTVAFANGGNRDAALLRAEPALWTRRDDKSEAAWMSLSDKVHPNIPVTAPKTPLVIKAGGVEVVTLSTVLDADAAQRAVVSSEGGAFVGIRVATMNSDGNLYLLEHAVARLAIDQKGRIQSADPAIHQSLSGFSDLRGAPPGDKRQENKKTPFVWAEQQGD